ncbi:ABC1 kinase family protein [Geosporobacter ferrireducens]|uniref:ABC1 kinase family protein n=1 Tax=Geosporobacter ferrireducens TaxID=1424294 RepID=UPI0009F59D42|nr:AarF/ABC1/UbiB kinase family protein [Geosporobacter ferrireducens]MTI55221.1 AarF/ABC1/UbiB kinase family protein [Geosporobacter ferrireducens]
MKRKILPGYRHLKRYKKIADIMVKYGFGYFVERLYHKGLVPNWIVEMKRVNTSLTAGQRLRMALEELGPTFVKLGQILSTRPDIVSEEVISELSKLQDHASKIPFSLVEKSISSGLGMNITADFHYFSSEPTAAASIGQVHCAKLYSGEDVVLKIQRPNIKGVIAKDIDILLQMATLFDEFYPGEMPFKVVEVVHEFSNSINRELDYTIEARNTEKFRENFQGHANVLIPKVYWEYTSKTILTLERIDGVKVADTETLKMKGWDIKEIGDLIATSFMKQVFIHGLFHGDPHPGNIFVVNEKKIAFIDFGIVGYLDKETMNFIADLFIAGAKKDIDKIVTLLVEIDALTEDTNIRRLKEDISFVLNLYYNTPLKRLNMSEAVSALMQIAYHNRVKLPLQFTILAKAVITLEGCVKMLNPDFSVSNIASQFIGEISAYRFNPKKILYEGIDYADDLFSSLKNFPRYLKSLLHKLERNEIKIIVDQIGVQKLACSLQEAGNRLSISLLIAALMLSSSHLITSTSSFRYILQMNQIGLIGYSAALTLVILFFIYVHRSKINKNK